MSLLHARRGEWGLESERGGAASASLRAEHAAHDLLAREQAPRPRRSPTQVVARARQHARIQRWPPPLLLPGDPAQRAAALRALEQQLLGCDTPLTRAVMALQLQQLAEQLAPPDEAVFGAAAALAGGADPVALAAAQTAAALHLHLLSGVADALEAAALGLTTLAGGPGGAPTERLGALRIEEVVDGGSSSTHGGAHEQQQGSASAELAVCLLLAAVTVLYFLCAFAANRGMLVIERKVRVPGLLGEH